ncbi:MAG: hydroxysqualene dehydroxylase HpnE [Janthinobacterium lividum]
MALQHVHVVGAGLAGLAAGLSLVEAGVRVTLHDAAPHAGGRCRSYHDPVLDCRIDNGNHLLLSGNRATFAFLDQVGARDSLVGPSRALFPFMDLGTGDRWTLRPNRGPVPWWLLLPGRRVPGMRLSDALPTLRLRKAAAHATVAGVLPPSALYHRLFEPLAIAALNTMPDVGSARLLGAIVQETLAAGGGACIPAVPRHGLSESFIDPALAWLQARGAGLQLGSRIGALATGNGRVTGLGNQALGPDEGVVLAVPAPVAGTLLPGLSVPTQFEAILNVHFKVDAVPHQGDLHEAGFMGLVGSIAEWVFVKPGIVSTTTSAGNRFLAMDTEAFAQQVWADVQRALQLPATMPPHRVVKEKRATFAATPAQEALRPPTRTSFTNLALAGDWTATGLPATIEGAIRSGRAAAATLQGFS